MKVIIKIFSENVDRRKVLRYYCGDLSDKAKEVKDI